MSTARDHISDVRSTHKLLSADSSINDRTILAALVRGRNQLINQRLNERKLWQTDSIFTTVCLEMQKVPLSECCNYISDEMIARSVLQLPKINEGVFNYAIKGVFNVETSKKFAEITPERYINILKLPKKRQETYTWISNNYVYATNPFLEAVKIPACFADHILPTEILYPKCDCGNLKYNLEDVCKNPLDREFKFADYLVETLIEMTSKFLLATYFNLATDKTSNNLDETSK